jgi:hypothetical protein
MINHRPHLRLGNVLPVSAGHIVAARGVAHDGANDVRRSDLIPDGLERTPAIVETAGDIQRLHSFPEQGGDLVGGAGERASIVDVVADVGETAFGEKYPVFKLGGGRLWTDSSGHLQRLNGFWPQGDYAGNFGFAAFEFNPIPLGVLVAEFGNVGVTDAAVNAQQEHGFEDGGSIFADSLDLLGGVSPITGLTLRRPHRLLAGQVELRPESERAVDMLVEVRPLGEGADRADVTGDGMHVAFAGELPPEFLPAAGGDVQGDGVVSEVVDGLLDTAFVPVVRSDSELAAIDLRELRVNEQLADVPEGDAVVGDDRLSAAAVQVLPHFLVVPLHRELGFAERSEPLHLSADLRHPPLNVTGEFDAGGCGGVVGFVRHNQKEYDSSVEVATSSVIIGRMEHLANPLFVGSNPTSASEETRGNKGDSPQTPSTSDNPELPDESLTNGGSGCGGGCGGDSFDEPLAIPLTRGFVTYIDRADLHLVSGRKWHAVKCKKRWYAASGHGKSHVYMHKLLCPASMVDHVDGDGLNNVRSNLRPTTGSGNSTNSYRKPNEAGYRGVYWHASMGKWRAEICKDRKRTVLGHFADPGDAAFAYDEAAIHLHGAYARTNFPIVGGKPIRSLAPRLRRSPATAIGGDA